MDLQRSVALDNSLSLTQASDPNYIANLDSLLYKTGYRKPNRTEFKIQVVDVDGVPSIYSLNGRSIVGITLNINPASMNLNMARIVNRTQTMSGWVEDHWGEELDTITFQGSTAGFIWGGPENTMPVQAQGPLNQSSTEIRNMFNEYMGIPDLGISEPVGTGDHSGLAVKRRRNTAAYDEFRQIIQLMNSNTATFDIHGLVNGRKYIQLNYDYALYRGYFESIDISEGAESPYRFTYTITFKAEKTIYRFTGQ